MTHVQPIWKRDVYETLVTALGVARASGLARRFRADLATRFAGHAGREELRRDAHAIVSAAGMLGFVPLSEAAQALEHACAADGDVTQPLASVLAARRAAEDDLAALLPGESPEARPLGS